MSIRLVELARSSNVHLFCLPPHTTHLLQPLDVGVFGPVKNAWRIVLKEHQIATVGSIVPQHFTSGFRRTGLCPLSRDAIPTSRLTKALPFSRPAMEPEPESQP